MDPASTKAVVLTLHRMSGGLKADQALAFRALAAEVQDAGYHFWILLHMVRLGGPWLSCSQQHSMHLTGLQAAHLYVVIFSRMHA